MEFICGLHVAWTSLILFMVTAGNYSESAGLIGERESYSSVCSQPRSLILHHLYPTTKNQSTENVTATILSITKNEFEETTFGDQETTTVSTERTTIDDGLDETTVPDKKSTIRTTTPQVITTKAATSVKAETTLLTTTKKLDETTIPKEKTTVRTTTSEIRPTTKAATTTEKIESTPIATTTKGLDTTTKTTVRTTTTQVLTTKAATTTEKIESTPMATTTKGLDTTTKTTTPQVDVTTKAATTTEKVESTPVPTTTEGLHTTTVKETTIRPTTPDNSVAEVCETWTIWGSSCYLFVSEEAPSWDAAAAQCLAYHDNAHLVFIGSASENNFVVGLVGSGEYPWIGLRKVGGEWVWSSQGTSVDASLTYTNWESSNNGEDCGYLTTSKKKWKSYECNAEDVFVCELEQ